MRRYAVLALALIINALAAATSFGADLSQVVRALEQGYGSLNDLQADFSQRSTLATMKREEKGGGEVFIKMARSGAMFRFNYTKPKQQIVSNGKTVWYYLPENKQVMVMEVSHLFEGGNSVALNYLTGMGHISRDFTAAFASQPRDKNGNYVLDLTPKKPTPAMTKLQLTVQGEAVDRFVAEGRAGVPFPIVSSVVYDQMGNTTRIEFSKVKTNRGVSSEKFTFKIPAGVEVVKR
ncbi:outer membrane lipoprotein carrier protein LolA [Geomonas sp. RF6]|uniref:LolA family protein n=1 Tax=Geomonas sp. RF6 TaxID=2897342 RepID=UPI001E6350A9|nr:outer membrane lipoprotein carrier protein LolA [Geomonas sp. RF6]UFS71569.1 outer membrane lipoprotein carrier protein LolA [Geomonas sp. RF6]